LHVFDQALRRASTAAPSTSETAEAAADARAAAPTVVAMDELVALCKRRGFVFQSSEVYNGFAGFYDYGPLGVELKKNIKDLWWRDVVRRRDDIVGLDSSIIASPKVSLHLTHCSVLNLCHMSFD
jgi:hypothetical protein